MISREYIHRLRSFLANSKAQGYPTVSRNGAAVVCVRSAAVQEKEMQQAAYMPQSRCTFNVLSGDAELLGLGLKKQFTDDDGLNYEVTQYQNHSKAMPWVVLGCTLVK